MSSMSSLLSRPLRLEKGSDHTTYNCWHREIKIRQACLFALCFIINIVEVISSLFDTKTPDHPLLGECGLESLRKWKSC